MDGKAVDVQDPFAIVVCGAEMPLSLERIFDVTPGEMVVQRSMGSIAGGARGTLFASLEYAVLRFAPKILLVLGESDSEIIATALRQVSGGDVQSAPMRKVLDRVMVSAMRA